MLFHRDIFYVKMVSKKCPINATNDKTVSDLVLHCLLMFYKNRVRLYGLKVYLNFVSGV